MVLYLCYFVLKVYVAELNPNRVHKFISNSGGVGISQSDTKTISIVGDGKPTVTLGGYYRN